MRLLSTLTAALFAGSLLVIGSSGVAEAKKAAGPKKSYFGCVVGKERWDASVGKCVAAKPVKKVAKKAAKPKAKKKA